MSVIKESVWVCDCACVNRRAIFDPRVCCSLFPQRKECGGAGEKRQDQSIEDQNDQTYINHHWTQATDATPVMFVNATDEQLNILVFRQQLTTVQKLVLKCNSMCLGLF